jgi:hypothetical protein
MPTDQQFAELAQKVKDLELKLNDLKYEIKDRLQPLLKTIYLREGDSTRILIGNSSVTVDWNGVSMKGPAIELEGDCTVRGPASLSLISGDASIILKKDGSIQIKGKDIDIKGSGKIDLQGTGEVKVKGKKILEN